MALLVEARYDHGPTVVLTTGAPGSTAIVTIQGSQAIAEFDVSEPSGLAQRIATPGACSHSNAAARALCAAATALEMACESYRKVN
jgi:hypothetical protein